MITIVASFELKPDCIEKFLELAEDCIACSRSEEGNIDYNLYVSRDYSNKYFFIENWKDEEAVKFHNSTEHFKKFADSFMTLLAKAPDIDRMELYK